MLYLIMIKKSKFFKFDEIKHSTEDMDFREYIDLPYLPHELDTEDRDYQRYLNKYSKYKNAGNKLTRKEYLNLVEEYAGLQEVQLKSNQYSSERESRLIEIAIQCLFDYS